ncbi:hypothetical protein MACK_003599 [Theileria orientalis]|uniref:Uncharacterized protein n=1 Tax=Theileria orientalis TaxID=68886 RepID=A0A976SJG1_THEOR|nr:hypothetical protein MACK_003599 [Theileria orientalis]
MLTYTPRSGKIFNLVKEAGTTIWSGSDASNYSDKVEVDLITNENKAVTVHLPNNKTNVYRKHGRNKPWKVIDTSTTNPQSVNIKYKYNSYFYINTQTSDGRRFEAKNGFAFNVVNEYINNNRVEIWKTDDEKDFAKKVEVEGNKCLIRDLMIHGVQILVVVVRVLIWIQLNR